MHIYIHRRRWWKQEWRKKYSFFSLDVTLNNNHTERTGSKHECMNLLIPKACALSLQSSKKHSELKACSASESFHPTLLCVCCRRRSITLACEVGRTREKKMWPVTDLSGKHARRRRIGTSHVCPAEFGGLLAAIHTQRARRAKPCHNTGIKKKKIK